MLQRPIPSFLVASTFVLALAAVRAQPDGAGGPLQAARRATEYFGQPLPGAVATPFAPGIVSTGLFERDLTMTPDGREIYWTVSSPGNTFVTTLVSRLEHGRWTPPDVVARMTDPGARWIEPAVSPDGKRLFFTLARPSPAGRIASAAIFVMEREGATWGSPRDIGAPVNGPGQQFFPSVTRSGTLYFTRERGMAADGIYRSRLVEGRYTEPERLPAQVNSGTGRYNAFVDPDERFLIVPMEGRPDSRGGTDYYVVFRNQDDTWQEPVNLGSEVNTPGSGEHSASLSPDGRHLFFMSSRIPESARPAALTGSFFRELLQRPQNGNADIYWIDAGFIEKLRK